MIMAIQIINGNLGLVITLKTRLIIWTFLNKSPTFFFLSFSNVLWIYYHQNAFSIGLSNYYHLAGNIIAACFAYVFKDTSIETYIMMTDFIIWVEYSRFITNNNIMSLEYNGKACDWKTDSMNHEDSWISNHANYQARSVYILF